MYRVALCEDEKVFLEEHKRVCCDILNKNGIEYRIETFDGGNEFLASFLRKGIRFDLILLDIIMDVINGMELAKQIRKHDTKASIIFITSSRNYALQGYDVNAFHYLIKPLDGEKLEKLILSDYHNKFQNNHLVFKSGLQNLCIPINDIIRLEIAARRVAITLSDRVVYYPGKLTELLEMLPEKQFVRCHQAYAINIRYTRELTRLSAFATNGVETPISRTFAKDVQRAFLLNMRIDGQ